MKVDISQALKVAMAKKKTDMTKVAKALGMNRTTVYRNFGEKSDPKWSMIEKVCGILDMSPIEFLEGGV